MRTRFRFEALLPSSGFLPEFLLPSPWDTFELFSDTNDEFDTGAVAGWNNGELDTTMGELDTYYPPGEKGFVPSKAPGELREYPHISLHFKPTPNNPEDFQRIARKPANHVQAGVI